MTIAMLGPQRFQPTMAEAARELVPQGTIATVTAGWREREDDDAELAGLLDGRGVNLRLYRRWLDVSERDPELAAADLRRRAVLDQLADAYLVLLHHAVEAVAELRRGTDHPQVRTAAIDDALYAVRELDARHLDRIRQVHEEFHGTWPLHERPVVAHHRDEVSRLLRESSGVAIAGGHVDVLLACLHLFDVAPFIGERPVVAWSAGAMVLTDRVVLFHDHAPHRRRYAEVHDAGLGLCARIVALPHARRRLDTGDRDRMSILARRFRPARCLVLDDGDRVDLEGEGCPRGARVVGADGTIETVEST